jgi:hypothetical protein
MKGGIEEAAAVGGQTPAEEGVEEAIGWAAR